jgi:hypothetical protein
MQQIASQKAPSPNIVVPHFGFGSVAWVVATLLITLSPDAFTTHFFNPKLLGITHLIVLGFISTIIFGALYQLIPVILDTKLFSEKLALFSFIALSAGAIILAFSFWYFILGGIFHLASTLILAAIFVFAFNIFKTAQLSENKIIERDFILTSVVWLLFTVIAGVVAGLNLKYAFLKTEHLQILKLHAHTGLIGWFMQLIMGVGSKLLPMFMVSHNLNKIKLNAAYYLTNVGLISSTVSFYFSNFIGICIAATLLIGGIILFVLYLTEAYKKRVKKNFDLGMKQSALSFISLLMAILFGFLLLLFTKEKTSLKVALSYGSLIIIGFIASLILGQTFKTLPFIIWLKVYKKLIGKGKLPLPKDLYSDVFLKLQMYFFFIGFVVFILGILLLIKNIISIGGCLLFISSILYCINTFKIILHKPKINYEN